MTLPVTKVDDADPGLDVAATAAEATTALAAGMYKLAAIGAPVKWKLGAVAVTQATGSYLADGDQEVIRVRAADTLRVIRAANATADGSVNVTVANLYEIDTEDPRF